MVSSFSFLFAETNGSWEQPYTVYQGIQSQYNQLKSVEGYIIGQPESSTSVLTEQFTNDYALVMADSPDETSIEKMLFIQVPSSFRTDFGLKSNPEIVGSKLRVTGYLTDYYAQPGVKDTSAMEIQIITSLDQEVVDATNNQDGRTVTLTGVVVGQPINSSSIRTDSFTNDYAVAIADKENETDVSKMLYVQIPSAYRESFGLLSNPSLVGESIEVTGELLSYYSHPGMKNSRNFTKINSSDGGEGASTTSPYDETYYQSAIGLTDNALKRTLHEIIDDHQELSYSNVWQALRVTDEDPNNSSNVILLYTGRSQDKYTNGGFVDEWNREHVWAKSHGDFGTSMGPGTDLHHLRPTDVSVNSTRGNLDFDNGGIFHTEATECKYDTDSWEPRDAVKGDVARMIFYMAVRYEGDDGEIDLEVSDAVENGSNPLHGKLSTLIKWHNQDPVDAFEQNRNEIIYNMYQHNRNPFIDHPEWVDEIWN